MKRLMAIAIIIGVFAAMFVPTSMALASWEGFYDSYDFWEEGGGSAGQVWGTYNTVTDYLSVSMRVEIWTRSWRVKAYLWIDTNGDWIQQSGEPFLEGDSQEFNITHWLDPVLLYYGGMNIPSGAIVWYIVHATSVWTPGTFAWGTSWVLPQETVDGGGGGGGGGCPFLQVWDGSDYADEGLLNIHNAEGVDVTYEHALTIMPERVNGAYAFRLTEHPQTISDIDQVHLSGVLENGTVKEFPLISAQHSEDGNVLSLLKTSDDCRAEEKGADHNGGTSQSIDLKFAALQPHVKVVAFIFTIEGNNILPKY